MAKRTPIKGRNLMLWLSNKTLGLATSCDLEINANYTQTATKDDGAFPSQLLDSVEWSVSTDALMSETGSSGDTQSAHDVLYTAMKNGTSVAVVVGTPTESTDSGLSTGWTAPVKAIYSGNAVVTSLKISAPVNGPATISVQLKGVGALTYTPKTSA